MGTYSVCHGATDLTAAQIGLAPVHNEAYPILRIMYIMLNNKSVDELGFLGGVKTDAVEHRLHQNHTVSGTDLLIDKLPLELPYHLPTQTMRAANLPINLHISGNFGIESALKS